MKILYSIQATGNGHISRAMELIPLLEKYGTVDLLLSGANSTLPLSYPVKYRSRGLSLFYTCTGTLDHWKLFKTLNPVRVMRDVKDLPVEKYDLILNDFDCITALACAFKKVRSVNFGHQASFYSPHTPRPDKVSKVGEWVLRNYARASQYVGLHFESYDDFILTPVIKKEILQANPKNLGHVTVYLPSYCDKQLTATFSSFKEFRFEIFSRETNHPIKNGNLNFIPVGKNAFDESLINCMGIVTGAGFETPAEALYLQKKLLAIPIKGQYEQQCNAAALKKLGATTLDRIDDDFGGIFCNWAENATSPAVKYPYSNDAIVEQVMMQVFENYPHTARIPVPDSLLLN